MNKTLLIGVLIWLIGGFESMTAQVTINLENTTLETKAVATGLTLPWDLVWAPDGWIWFTERGGAVKRLNPETGEIIQMHQEEEVFESTDNSGMYAMVLHPDFPLVPYVYINYTHELTKARLVRYTYDSQRDIFRDSVHIIPYLRASESHNGARLLFTPDRKILYATGDTYRGERCQDLNYLTGKILRLNPDGTAPEDNPVKGNLAWSWGHRNPQGLVLTPQGNLFESEHGSANDDELNLIKRGRNYGWPNVRGFCDQLSESNYCADSMIVEPLLTWTPTGAPAGLDYFNHPSIPEWQNSLLQGFLKAGANRGGQRLTVVKLTEDQQNIISSEDHLVYQFGRIRDILVAPDGRIFICTSNQEKNGSKVVQPEDDQIIEIKNSSYNYETPGLPGFIPAAVKVYPNPAESQLFINLPVNQGEATISLLDLAGRKMSQENLSLQGYTYIFDRVDVPNGIYLLEVRIEGREVETVKVQFF